MTPPMQSFNVLRVALDPGITLVEASAGTGKTFAITRLVLRLLLERKVDHLGQILVVTFTEKATQELIGRIRAVLRDADRVWSDTPPARDAGNDDLFVLRDLHGEAGGPIVRSALAALDDLGVSTIHGFCHRVLTESALESRVHFGGTFLEDDTEILQRLTQDWIRRQVLHDEASAALIADRGEDPQGWIRNLVRPYMRHPRTSIDAALDAAPQLLRDFVLSVSQAFEQEKQARHLMGFDDLLRRLHDILVAEGPHGLLASRIRERFQVALIDEFQDTDPTQFPIFSTAFSGCPLFLIGDPKQSIFAFRNADVRAYLKAAANIEQRYTLLTNYRSTDVMVRAVTQLFGNNREPFACSPDLIGVPQVTAANQVRVPDALLHDGKRALEWMWVGEAYNTSKNGISKERGTSLAIRAVTVEIRRLTTAGVGAGAMAVLVRTNAEAQEVKASLDAAGILSVVGANQDVLASEEAHELVCLAEAIASPRDGVAVRAAMATRLWGCDANAVADTLRNDGTGSWNGILDQLVRARTMWLRHGGATALSWLLNECGATARLLSIQGGERRVTNLRHVLEILQEADALSPLMPDAVLGWVSNERASGITPERREMRLESDVDAVQILTIHKAKGLQWPVVFCPTLWNSRSFAQKALGVPYSLTPLDDGMVLDIGSPMQAARREQKELEQLGEDLRLAYVALTRAESRCYVTWGNFSDAATSSIGWLVQGGGETIDRDAIDALVAANADTMALSGVVLEMPATPALAPRATAAARTPLQFKTAAGQLSIWRSSSFTMLTRNVSHVDSRDVDDILQPDEVRLTAAYVSGFRGVPAGADIGNVLHGLFEHTDFTNPDATTDADVQDTLRAYGVAIPRDGRWTPAHIREMIAMVCRAAIPGAEFALTAVPHEATLREWRFSMPVRDFSIGAVADAIAEHGSDHAREYAPMLRRLRDDQFRGYLTGSIDLAFEHDGRWHILDWKSNWLGANDADYAADALGHAMHASHYTLQYHVYLVALHRHLTARQPGYDARHHWGQVTYAFLRGIAATGHDGWFTDAPTPALLRALDRAFGGTP
ncbi:UvrD-helicase domain-containing protein [Gemmatimonas sp.]|uniref:UvrD-helicase domain-containing protein n=1 Tax=Gemmatimonas sp. TaxID=1962908 RepID=UPI00286AE3DB|nr:UvrD-helicase domain-containing protein [Gemmatimonas sp.]